jgi:hypothetical protein
MLGVASQVDLGGQRSVGASGQINFLIAQPVAHFVNVVHADGGGVEAQVGDLVQAFAAGADYVEWE